MKISILDKKDDLFSIKFFFLETMMRKNTMYIQFDFDLINQQLIGYNQGSGPNLSKLSIIYIKRKSKKISS